MSPVDHRGEMMTGATLAALKAVILAAAVYFYVALAMGGPGDSVCIIVFVCATISSVAGFAFSAISGSMLLRCERPYRGRTDHAGRLDRTPGLQRMGASQDHQIARGSSLSLEALPMACTTLPP